MFYISFLVIQDIAYYIVIWELLGKMEERFWFIFKWIFKQKNWILIGSHRAKDPRDQDAKIKCRVFPHFHNFPDIPQVNDLTRILTSIQYCLTSSVQPPPWKLSHKGHHGIWQGEEAILQRCACVPSDPAGPAFMNTDLYSSIVNHRATACAKL